MHNKKFKALSRPASQRKALLANQAKALIQHKRIITTLAKAKALRRFVEPIITKAKTNTMHARRTVFASFQDKEPVKMLFNEIAAKVGQRPGGYTRVIRLERRLGDRAAMGMVELVDYSNLVRKTRRKAPVPQLHTEETHTEVAPASPDHNVTKT